MAADRFKTESLEKGDIPEHCQCDDTGSLTGSDTFHARLRQCRTNAFSLKFSPNRQAVQVSFEPGIHRDQPHRRATHQAPAMAGNEVVLQTYAWAFGAPQGNIDFLNLGYVAAPC